MADEKTPASKYLEWRVNDFAIRCFRDTADGDYIAARLACRAALLPQYLWASQQAIEKYLKCILLLRRIRSNDVKHDLSKALNRLVTSGFLTELCDPTRKFIQYLDGSGRFRYLEVSQWGHGRDIVTLDRAVWELRRHCTLPGATPYRIVEGVMTPNVRLPGGFLERLIDGKVKKAGSSRAALLWQNGFFGRKLRRVVMIGSWMTGINSPLTLAPEILDEVLKYVYLPKDVILGYREHAKRVANRRKKSS